MRKNDREPREGRRSAEESDSSSEDDSSSYERERRRKRTKKAHKQSERKKSHKKSKRKKSSSSRRRRYDEYSSDSDAGCDASTDSHRRHKKKNSKKRRKDDRKDTLTEREQKSFQLADALLDLFSKHPGMAEDLPILLIRLCNGTTFSLHDSPVQEPLEKVLACLALYGVQKDGTGTFSWDSPAASKQNQELTLLRVVRSLLDEIGLTAVAVINHEQGGNKNDVKKSERSPSTLQEIKPSSTQPSESGPSKDIPLLVQRIFTLFPSLQKELPGLCQTILEGESVSLDGLADPKLMEELSTLFELCRLEQNEMEDDDDEDDKKSTIMGFGLPEDGNSNVAIASIKAVIQVCESKAPRVMGAMRPPPNYNPDSDDDEDEIGPQLTPRDNVSYSKDEIMASARRRQMEMNSVQAGLDPSVAAAVAEGGREEWMLVPGQHEFLDAIKSGKPIKNRQFQNVASFGADDDGGPQIDPKIQAEMDALMAAHQESRGISLMEEHQASKQEQQKGGKKKEWQWNRSKDLDSGRRVDKNALNMVLGGASSGLASKFQGGLHSTR